MSGHFEALILGMGALTVALSVWLSAKMNLIDREGMPVHTFKRVVPFSIWLLREVIISNVTVAKQVLFGDPAIEPTVFEVPDGQRSDVGRALYGNSITLTPGTVTVEADGSTMCVHALSKQAADDLREGEMSRRVAAVDRAPRSDGAGH